ncbi:Xaa-Pro peptidase family protein [Roseobacter sp. OBYS 0001]|uniref:M24 family metallopeptidase n=1 Tax=Roseobacter sp. OBYS 0001 TaxID=882651 RepID=UPI001BC2B856|nr:Xaa-Pro peptidase family protein [Roseobacter sp. OBYS 0001]GIT87986.1 dipeptidase [Roseobacter sp. OBYS 0001]
MSAAFETSEYRLRTEQVQNRMASLDIAALLLTTEADVRYITGFMTRFWESPTRPWFVIVPATGVPIAVIPSIGKALMKTTWISEIRSWRAPNYEDDGVTLLAQTLCETVPKGARIAVPGGGGTQLRMPLQDWQRLQAAAAGRVFVGDGDLMAAQRMVKSEAEISRIAKACGVADRAFARVPEIASAGTSLRDVFRRFQMLCLDEGADWVPYLAGGAGPGGVRDVISPATDNPLQTGDVLMLDTGLVRDGYFCDFDRNFSIGPPSPATMSAHARLIAATQAAFDVAKAGCTAADLFRVMDDIVTDGQGGSDAGRLGHGLGLQLTEPPSLIAQDHTVLQAGMVLTLEPGIDLGDGRILVHEENIVIREDCAEWLSTPAGPEMMVLPA